MDAGNIIALAIVVLLALASVSVFNRLVALKRRCDQAFGDIDVQIKQRHDLIPNLVEAVKGYATHERDTLTSVTAARAAATSAKTPAEQAAAETVLSGALARLMVVAEAYPKLQASEGFMNLQSELSYIENKIAAARRFLNGAVTEYNTAREQFPANILAPLFGLGPNRTIYDLGESRQAVETAPQVRFSNP